VSVLVELGIADPMPALNAPAVAYQLQQCFWRGAQAGNKELGGPKGLAVAAAGGRHLHDPAGADPSLADVFWCILGTQCPGDVAAMADLMIRSLKRDVPLSLELAVDLAAERLLVRSLLRRSLRLHRQEEVGPPLLELPKNGFWVCRASAWISTPSRFSSPSNCLRTARSWFSAVA